MALHRYPVIEITETHSKIQCSNTVCTLTSEWVRWIQRKFKIFLFFWIKCAVCSAILLLRRITDVFGQLRALHAQRKDKWKLCLDWYVQWFNRNITKIHHIYIVDAMWPYRMLCFTHFTVFHILHCCSILLCFDDVHFVHRKLNHLLNAWIRIHKIIYLWLTNDKYVLVFGWIHSLAIKQFTANC